MNVLEQPTPAEAKAAQETLPFLQIQGEQIQLLVGSQAIPLNPLFVRLLKQILEQVRLGKPISILPLNAELTTQQAAALLNVSRPFVSKLIRQGELAYEMRGTHRRLRLEELLRYQQSRSMKRKAALAELSELSQEYGLPD